MGSTDSQCCGSHPNPSVADDHWNSSKSLRKRKGYRNTSPSDHEYSYDDRPSPWANPYSTRKPSKGSNHSFTYNINISSNVPLGDGLTLSFNGLPPIATSDLNPNMQLNRQLQHQSAKLPCEDEQSISDLSEAIARDTVLDSPTPQLGMNHTFDSMQPIKFQNNGSNLVHSEDAKTLNDEEIKQLEIEMLRELRRLSVSSMKPLK